MNQPVSAPQAAAAAAAATTTMQIHPLDITTVSQQSLQNTLRITGSLTPHRQVQLTAQVSGTAVAVNAHVGDSVRAGETLLQIDIETLRLQVEQQRSSLAANRAQLGLAESQLERSERLAERGITASSTLESDQSNLDIQRANVAVQEADQVHVAPAKNDRPLVPSDRNCRS